MGEEVLSEADFRRALERTWWPVARCSELGQPQQAQLLDRKLAVFRGRDGNARVVDDRCPHRGASLSRGEVLDDAIQCPYHGWQWDGASGRCINVPSLSDQGQIPSSARVRNVGKTRFIGWSQRATSPLQTCLTLSWSKHAGARGALRLRPSTGSG